MQIKKTAKLLVKIAMQVSETQFNALVTHRSLNREDYDLNLAQDRLKTFLESKQIPYVDLLESLRVTQNGHYVAETANGKGHVHQWANVYRKLRTPLPGP